MGLWNILGALLVTYFVSRLVLALALSFLASSWRLVLVHLASWLLVAGSLALLRWTPFGGYDVEAGLPYLLPQILWFLYDALGEPQRASRA